MKYEDPIKFCENDAHAIILKKIHSKSMVLEFGAASGRMTKILCEKLGCKVYIVECVKEAFDKAILYAEEGICDDIELMTWYKKWHGISFDYIILADVLEHLKNPIAVLQNTKELLKEEGKLILSIPNIAHNDILIKLFYNKFDYTDIGILDDTHLHFWAENNLGDFESGTGYHIEEINYKTIKTGNTEQFRNFDLPISHELQNLLNQRNNGEVYQFILTMGLNADISLKKDGKIDPYITCKFYIDWGNGFSEKNVEFVDAYMLDNGCYSLSYEFKEIPCKIRLDVVEGKEVMVYYAKCVCNNIELIPEYSNNILTSMGRIVLGKDPQIIWKTEGRREACYINVKFRLFTKIFEIPFREIKETFQSELDNIKIEIKGLQKEVEEKDTQNSELQNDLLNSKKEMNRIQMEKREIEEKINILLEEKVEVEKKYNDIINSGFWRKTEKIRKVISKISTLKNNL